MQVLHIKLIRDLRRLWAQVLAIALVMAAGVATIILGAGTYQSLSQSRASYYETNQFADVFANVTRAPKGLVPDIEAIEGVAIVEPRIVKIALVDFDDMKEPASAMLVSLPDNRLSSLNRVYLRSGRMPEPEKDAEAVISEGFAKAHELSIGSSIRVLINGVRRSVRVTGVALSPEFIYAIGPGDLMPDERRFGILWMSEKAMAAAYDLNGAFSNIAVKLLPGASETRVIEKIDVQLARYGGQGAYGRKDQISHSFIEAELTQLKALSRVLPPIFLIVAAFLVNMTLTRLITLEREQIGLLKALGYSSWAIVRHYIEFVILIAVLGILIGLVAGIFLGNGLTVVYARFFSFPILVFSRSPEIYAIAAIVTVASAVIGAIKAVSDVAWLPPAVAMSPAAPALFHKFLGNIFDFSRYLSQSSVMISRHLLHSPWRTASSTLGIAFAVAIMVGSLWSFGSIEHMIDFTFQRADRQDATISFTSPRPIPALYSVEHLPGITRAEPYRAVAVKLKFGHVERRLALMGKPKLANLSRVLDHELRPISMPESGVVLSASLANILGTHVGDVIQVELLEGDRSILELSVSAVVESYFGIGAYMDIEALNHMLRESDMISGVNVSIDQNQESQLFSTLKATPSVNSIALLKISMQKFRTTLAQNIYMQVAVYVSLAAIIAFGVVYNSARISLSEQGREMASLRVLGFTRAEVSSLLISELAAVVIVAQPLGWLIGSSIAYAMLKAFSSELYQIPFVVGPEVYAYSSLVVIFAALLCALVVRRRIDQLDLIAVLKTRE